MGLKKSWLNIFTPSNKNPFKSDSSLSWISTRLDLHPVVRFIVSEMNEYFCYGGLVSIFLFSAKKSPRIITIRNTTKTPGSTKLIQNLGSKIHKLWKLLFFFDDSFLYHWLNFLSTNYITDTISHRLLYKVSLFFIKVILINNNHNMNVQ